MTSVHGLRSQRGASVRPLMRRAWTPEEFYREFDEPPHVQDITESVQAFVETHRQAGHKVVLVTSGGTTVPLEKNMVRFLDNFSAGTRGACLLYTSPSPRD